MDQKTIDLYNRRAADYDRLTTSDSPDPLLAGFISRLPSAARVLDLGCGSGIMAGQMARAGLRAEAWDASSEMVALANRHSGVTAHQRDFDALPTAKGFDGIWANFSLLHAPKSDMPRHLAAIHHALRPGGQFQLALKCGEGEARDRLGRFYSYYQQDEVHKLLSAAGFTVTKTVTGRDKGLDGTFADWLSVASHG